MPTVAPHAFALFSHCFTCTKDLKSIVRISRHLARHGFGVLRFDFTGLGDSQGDFSHSNFETNLLDIEAAVGWLSSHHEPPQLLVGHSLGGAAMMASVSKIPSARCLVTLASPCETEHLAEFLVSQNPAIETDGQAQFLIGGRNLTMRSQLLESFRNRDLRHEIASLTIPHLILHSPVDETLAFQHAEQIFSLTGGPKSLVTLDGADHLLVNQPEDISFVGNLISLWSTRFIANQGDIE